MKGKIPIFWLWCLGAIAIFYVAVSFYSHNPSMDRVNASKTPGSPVSRNMTHNCAMIADHCLIVLRSPRDVAEIPLHGGWRFEYTRDNDNIPMTIEVNTFGYSWTKPILIPSGASPDIPGGHRFKFKAPSLLEGQELQIDIWYYEGKK